MFADQLKLQDQVKLELKCEHRYTGGEMRCLHCGSYYLPNSYPIAAELEVYWTDSFKYLEEQDG